MNKVILSFGSNLGDREQNIIRAKDLLLSRKIINDYKMSCLMETKAILKDNSPKEWNLNYINAAALGYTNLSPHELFLALKKIEKELGRDHFKRWAPRTIDIDIIFFENMVICTNDIQVPHAELLKRPFLLELIYEIAPDYLYPVSGRFYKKTIKEIRESNG